MKLKAHLLPKIRTSMRRNVFFTGTYVKGGDIQEKTC